MEAVETIEYQDLRISIFYDEDAENPREVFEEDRYGTFVDWHRRENVGDRKITELEESALKRGGWKLLTRYLRATQGAVCVLPVSLLDHSGWHVWVGGGAHWSDSAGWDSGTVGFIYATREEVDKFGIPEDQIEKQLRAEIETLDQLFTGDVYGYTIETEYEEELESCWGIFGFECVKEEAMDAAKGLRPEVAEAVSA